MLSVYSHCIAKALVEKLSVMIIQSEHVESVLQLLSNIAKKDVPCIITFTP